MAFLETRYEHIVLGEDGVPRIAGTGTKIIELVLDKLAYNWSLEEIQFQHPHLALGRFIRHSPTTRTTSKSWTVISRIGYGRSMNFGPPLDPCL